MRLPLLKMPIPIPRLPIYCTYLTCGRRPVVGRCEIPVSPTMTCGISLCQRHHYKTPNGKVVCWAHRGWDGVETVGDFLVRAPWKKVG